MGIGPFKRSSSVYDYSCKPNVVNNKIELPKPLPNPNPYNYNIIKCQQVKNALVVMVEYPDCTNYEGKKILVYRDLTVNNLIMQGSVDPHFSENNSFYSPVARFLPTDEGWKWANDFARYLEE